jgi:hypothetical protein
MGNEGKIKLKLSTLSTLSSLKNEEIGECMRSLFDYFNDGVIPDRRDKLFTEKSILINSAKRSLTAIDVAMNKKLSKELEYNDPKIIDFKKQFSELYMQIYGMKYNFSKADNDATIELLNKVEELVEKKGIPTTPEKIISNAMIYIRKVVALNDNWINANFCIGVLNKRFEKNYVRIKYEEQQRRNSSISNEYIQNAISGYTGEAMSDDC